MLLALLGCIGDGGRGIDVGLRLRIDGGACFGTGTSTSVNGGGGYGGGGCGIVDAVWLCLGGWVDVHCCGGRVCILGGSGLVLRLCGALLLLEAFLFGVLLGCVDGSGNHGVDISEGRGGELLGSRGS